MTSPQVTSQSYLECHYEINLKEEILQPATVREGFSEELRSQEGLE
jgi:hypothetical protein